MNIITEFNTDVAKKILGNKAQATLFLFELQKIKKFDLPFRTVTRGAKAGQKVITLTTDQLWEMIVDHWDFKVGQKIIRNLFKNTPKYKSGKASHTTMKTLLTEWSDLKLGNISWPFSQGDFDGFVQRVNAENIPGDLKDIKVKEAAVKYRRIKEINTVRNDFIETLIFEKNDNILPTLSHRRSVDFFINGISFDQKVAKSPTSEFQKDYGENWKEYAIQHPEAVAQYLYQNQDEGRFGADSRLLVVYLEDNVPIEKIATIINQTNLSEPISISFDYHHKSVGLKSYKVNCFVILLYN